MNKSPILLLVVLASLLGLALRLHGLTAGLLSLDESYTLVEAQSSVADIFRLAPTDPNPPLTSLAYKLWTAVFGTSELAWELLAALLGTLAIPLLAWLGSRTLGAEAGAVSAWLLAASPLHVNFSQQVRSYALAIVLSLLASAALVWYLERPGRGRALGFLGAAWLFFNTHYYGFLVVFAWLGGALAAAPRRNLRRVVLLSLGVLATSLPTLLCLYLQYTSYYSFGWIAEPDPWLLVQVLQELAGSLSLTVLLGGLAALGAAAVLRDRRLLAAAVLLSWLLLPALLAFAASALGRPFLHPRYAVLWLAPLLLFAARGVVALPMLWLRVAAVALAVLLALPLLRSDYALRQAEAIFKAELVSIGERYRPGDVVLHLSKTSYVPALFYHRRLLEEYFLAGTQSSNVMRYWMREKTELAPEELGKYRRAWIVREPGLPQDALAAFLRAPEFRAHSPIPVSTDDLGTVLLFALASESAE